MGPIVFQHGRIDQLKPYAIVFNGPPGSGKDEACHYLVASSFQHLSFKKTLFVETAAYFGVDLDWFMKGYNDRSIKERPEPLLNSLSRRDAMIFVSEQIIKPRYGLDYFGVKTAQEMIANQRYCLSDGGFYEEFVPLINTLGADHICIVQLYRSGCSFSKDSRRYISGNLQETYTLGFEEKSSELLYQDDRTLPIRMYIIHNNASIADFHSAIDTIIRKEEDVIFGKENKSYDLLRKSI